MAVVKFGGAQFIIERDGENSIYMNVNYPHAEGLTVMEVRGTPDEAEALKNALEDADAQKDES